MNNDTSCSFTGAGRFATPDKANRSATAPSVTRCFAGKVTQTFPGNVGDVATINSLTRLLRLLDPVGAALRRVGVVAGAVPERAFTIVDGISVAVPTEVWRGWI